MPQLDFNSKIDDHGVRRGDTGRILARWRRPVAVASRVAIDLPYWAMRSALYRLIRTTIKMDSKVGAFILSSILCHA
jgi:hypothetical protein